VPNVDHLSGEKKEWAFLHFKFQALEDVELRTTSRGVVGGKREVESRAVDPSFMDIC